MWDMETGGSSKMTSPLNFGGSVCTAYAGILSYSNLDNTFREPFSVRRALKNSITEEDVSTCAGDGVHYASPEVDRMETCDESWPSFRIGNRSVSKSSLRSVMCGSLRSTLTSFKIVAVCKDEDEGYK